MGVVFLFGTYSGPAFGPPYLRMPSTLGPERQKYRADVRVVQNMASGSLNPIGAHEIQLKTMASELKPWENQAGQGMTLTGLSSDFPFGLAEMILKLKVHSCKCESHWKACGSVKKSMETIGSHAGQRIWKSQ